MAIDRSGKAARRRWTLGARSDLAGSAMRQRPDCWSKKNAGIRLFGPSITVDAWLPVDRRALSRTCIITVHALPGQHYQNRPNYRQSLSFVVPGFVLVFGLASRSHPLGWGSESNRPRFQNSGSKFCCRPIQAVTKGLFFCVWSAPNSSQIQLLECEKMAKKWG